MQTYTPPFDINALSVPERIQLAQHLWDNIHDLMQPAPLTAEQTAEVRQRIADIQAGRTVCEPFDDVMRELRRR